MTYWDNAPPDPIEVVATVLGSNAATASWSPSPLRTTTLYGAAHWGQSGLASYDFDKINDGLLAAPDVALTDAPGSSRVWLDAEAVGGVGAEFTFGEVWIVYLTKGDAPTPQYSADASSWSDLASSLVSSWTDGGLTYEVYRWTAAAHRAFGLNFAGSVANEIVDVWFRGYGDAGPVGHYVAYDTSSGSRVRIGPEIQNAPSVALPLHVGNVYLSSGIYTVSLVICAVSPSGDESPGVAVTASFAEDSPSPFTLSATGTVSLVLARYPGADAELIAGDGHVDDGGNAHIKAGNADPATGPSNPPYTVHPGDVILEPGTGTGHVFSGDAPTLYGCVRPNDGDTGSHTDLGSTSHPWRVIYLSDDSENWVTSIRNGDGSPEGVVYAPVGSLYLRGDGGAGTTLYVKESGDETTNTGWAAK